MQTIFEQKEIQITEELIKRENLKDWAASFELGTAGYRAQMDPEDAENSQVAFNALKMAIIAEAKACVYDEMFKDENITIEHHVGGEVRPHTQDFIKLVARIYAAHGHMVHLRSKIKTTPIWYSSFGVFYKEYTDGENFTASHSPNFKGGWKPMDGDGKQLLKEAVLIVNKVKESNKPMSAMYCEGTVCDQRRLEKDQAEVLTNEKLLESECDILIPAALDNQITEENAPRIKARVILELANNPTTPEADEILNAKGVIIVPDILTNAGGVTVSYLEWVQGLGQFYWTKEKVLAELKEIMRRSFNDVWKISQEKKLSMRKAAFLLAVQRIVEAMKSRGI